MKPSVAHRSSFGARPADGFRYAPDQHELLVLSIAVLVLVIDRSGIIYRRVRDARRVKAGRHRPSVRLHFVTAGWHPVVTDCREIEPRVLPQ